MSLEYPPGMIIIQHIITINYPLIAARCHYMISYMVIICSPIFTNLFPDFGDTSPKRLYQPLFLFRLRTPLREMFQIRDFSASPKITFQKVKNSLFMGTLRDCYLTKC